MSDRISGIWFRLAIAIGSLALIAYFGRHYLGELDRLRQAHVLLLPIILVLYFAARAVTSELMRFGLRILGHPIPFGEAMMLTVLVSYTNLALPRAGWGPTAVYLKRMYRVPLAEFGSILLPLVAVQIPCIGALGLLSQFLLASQRGIAFDPTSSLVFATCLAAGVGLPLFGLRIPSSRSGRIAAFLRRFSDSWRRLAASPRTLCIVIAGQIAVLLLRAIRLDVAFTALEQDPPFWGVCVASLLADVIFILSITPSALGLREAAIAYSSEAMGIPASMALVVTILDRLTWVVGVVVVGQWSLWKLRARSGGPIDKEVSA